MICLTVTDYDDVGFRKSVRPREALRRALVLIEQLSACRFGMAIQDIRERVIDAIGVVVCERTIQRDLDLLESLGLVERLPNRLWRLGPRRRIS